MSKRIPGFTEPHTEETYWMERVPDEGPVEHIRNALQILNGLSYMLDTMRYDPESSTLDGPALVRESTEGLEQRLSAALSLLMSERASHVRMSDRRESA